MTVSENTIWAEGPNCFFRHLGKESAKAGRNLVTIVLKYPGSALDNTANIATAVASQNPKTDLSSLPEVINFHHRAKGLLLGKFVYFMLYKLNKEATD